MKVPTQPLIALILALVALTTVCGQTRIEKNVVFGMYSGLALLMDVHRPEKPNGYGVIFVPGSGWQMPLSYDAVALKEREGAWAVPLVNAGYTVFTVNHRAAPRFHYSAAVDDVQRAVRFVRHRAQQFGIDGTRLGGLGGSSGAHLVGLVAMIGAGGLADDPDPVNREPASLQAIVIRAAPTDLRIHPSLNAVSFMELMPPQKEGLANTPESWMTYTAASPIAHVSASAPPTLLIHGDGDATVAYEQSVAMEAALSAANVPVRLLRIAGGGHGRDFRGPGFRAETNWPDYFGETVRWLDTHLKAATNASPK